MMYRASYMKKTAITLAILALASGEASAKNCTSGQPCGNSCISWSSTCHIGTTTTPTTTPTTTTTTVDCQTNPASCGLFTQVQIDAARQTGIDQCRTNPVSCGITPDTNGSTQTGIDQCKTSPASCGITVGATAQEIDNAKQAGIDQCKNNPASYGLFTQKQIEIAKQTGASQCKPDTACGVTVATNHPAYDGKKGEVHIPHIDVTLTDEMGNPKTPQGYEVYLLQKPHSFMFELDFTRLKTKE